MNTSEWKWLKREYGRLSLLLAARDFSPGGTLTPLRQKFHADDVNQYLHVFIFLLVDYGKVLCPSAKELQQNSDDFSKE